MAKESKKDKRSDKKALNLRERLDPDVAGSRWDLPAYKEMERRKGK